MTIDLPTSLLDVFAKEARLRGVAPEQFVLQKLHEVAGAIQTTSGNAQSLHSAGKTEPANAESDNLYEQYKHLIGKRDSSEFIPGGLNMSRDTGKQFAELLTPPGQDQP